MAVVTVCFVKRDRRGEVPRGKMVAGGTCSEDAYKEGARVQSFHVNVVLVVCRLAFISLILGCRYSRSVVLIKVLTFSGVVHTR